MRPGISLTLLVAAGLGTAACGLLLSLPDATTLGADAGPGSERPPGDGDSGPLDGAIPADAQSCEVDVSKDDPLNCGVCKRSCLGGACSAGRCAPFQLATVTGALSMTIDDAFVYWVDGIDAFGNTSAASVRRVPKSGGATEVVASEAKSQSGVVTPIGTDGSNVVWKVRVASGGGDDRVLSCPRSGCSDSGPSSLLTTYKLDGLAVGDGQLYVAGYINPDSAIWHVPTDGGAPEVVRAFVGNVGNTYLAAAKDLLVRASLDVRKGRPTADAGEVVVGNASGFFTALATDGKDVAWADTVGSVHWTHADRIFAASGQASPSGIALDARHVYWTNQGDETRGNGSLVACPVDGCPPEGPLVLVAPLESPPALAIDATHVYFIASGPVQRGAVWRVPKL